MAVTWKRLLFNEAVLGTANQITATNNPDGTVTLSLANDLLTKAQFADIYRQGFTNLTETSISFNGTNTFTLTSVGATWTYYRAGIKYTITGSKSVVIPGTPIATGHWHIYIDSTDGALLASTDGWSLLDTKVPVATIEFNNSLTPKYWLADERHTVLIDQRMQYILHATVGAKLATTPAIVGTLTVGNDNDAAKACGFSACAIIDQDLRTDIALLAEPDGATAVYALWYRTSATAWSWVMSDQLYAYGTYIKYDLNGTLTEGQNNKYYNTYLLVTNLQGAARYTVVSGRGEFSTLLAAQAEDLAAWSWGTFDIDEAVICYRFTWYALAANSSKGKCTLAALPKTLNLSTVTNASSGAGTDHNTLSDLQGGSETERYHLTATEHADLTDGGDTTLHGHTNIPLANLETITIGSIVGRFWDADGVPEAVDYKDWMSAFNFEQSEDWSAMEDGISAGQLQGLHKTDFVQADGSIVGASTYGQQFTNYVRTPYVIWRSDQTTHADSQYFDANVTGVPSGWTEVDAAATVSQTQKNGLLFFKGNTSETSWKYAKQMTSTFFGSGCTHFTFGPIYFRDGFYTTGDITYRFGLYNDNGGALGTTTYFNVGLKWNAALTPRRWQIFGERETGGAKVDAPAAFDLPLYTVPQPIYLGIGVYAATGTLRTYFGYSPIVETHTLINTVAPSPAYDWDASNPELPWMVMQMTRSSSTGLDDYLYIGGIEIGVVA